MVLICPTTFFFWVKQLFKYWKSWIKDVTLEIYINENVIECPGHFLSTLNGKFYMKSYVMNTLKIVIVDFLKE